MLAKGLGRACSRNNARGGGGRECDGRNARGGGRACDTRNARGGGGRVSQRAWLAELSRWRFQPQQATLHQPERLLRLQTRHACDPSQCLSWCFHCLSLVFSLLFSAKTALFLLAMPQVLSGDTSGIAAAVAMAAAADVVILAVGTDLTWAHEEHDAENITFTDAQIQLIEQVPGPH